MIGQLVAPAHKAISVAAATGRRYRGFQGLEKSRREFSKDWKK